MASSVHRSHNDPGTRSHDWVTCCHGSRLSYRYSESGARSISARWRPSRAIRSPNILLYSVGLSTGLIRCSRDLMAAICLLTARAPPAPKPRPHTWRRALRRLSARAAAPPRAGSRSRGPGRRAPRREVAPPIPGRRPLRWCRRIRRSASNTAACTGAMKEAARARRRRPAERGPLHPELERFALHLDHGIARIVALVLVARPRLPGHAGRVRPAPALRCVARPAPALPWPALS